MDSQTLTFYSFSAGLCFGISLLLIGYAQLQRGTILIRSTALAMLILAVAFFMAGYATLLPVWLMRVVTNMLLLYASVVLYQGFHAYLHDKPPRFDRIGAVLVAATLPFFIWWGLIEPDGILRSIVFSLTAAILNSRIAWILLALVRRNQGGMPAKIMTVLFVLASLWMLGRTGALVLTAPVPVDQQGANPTTWVTVFWFNVLAAAITATLLAMDMARHKARQARQVATALQQGIENGHSNLVLLWTLVAIITLTILAQVGIAYSVLYQREHQQLRERMQMANKAFVAHTQQVIGQVDLLIRTTRKLVEQHTPHAEMEAFIRQLQFPRDQIENVFVIDAAGAIVVPQADRARGQFAMQRDYFQFHLNHVEDELYIAPVSVGQVTGKYHFRLTRRLSDAQGRFAGVVVVPLEPEAFTELFQRLLPSPDAIAVLLHTSDKKIRARSPAIDVPDQYQLIVDNTPLWDAFTQAPQGEYRNNSPIDGIERHFTYQRVGDLPLVMVSGFSLTDVHRHALESIKPIGLGALLALAVVLSLATILTGVIRRRDEQESFIAMLGHELKTPLSVIRMTVSSAAIAPESEARIGRAVTEMQNVIERCVQADKLDHGLVSLKLEQINLNELLIRLCENASEPARIKLDAPSIPRCRSDRQLLGIILANLIDNAIKYGQRDAEVHLSARPAKLNGRTGIAIQVSNPSGKAGMPDPQRVFRKYYRAAAAHGKTGSGLGLHIAAGFARLLGGRLRYLPAMDEVRFELWLPADNHADAVLPAPTFS